MALYASWIHGNALTVESPENLATVGRLGWGADMAIIPGKASWFHIPVPTPVIVDDKRTTVQKLFLLFKIEPVGSGNIRNVHIYDGIQKVQEFNELDLHGDHLVIDGENTFNLVKPHTVAFGMGISFFFRASIGFDSQVPPSRVIVSTAGGDFLVTPPLNAVTESVKQAGADITVR